MILFCLPQSATEKMFMINEAKKSLGSLHGARSKWGQNFLRDPKILRKIADQAQLKKSDVVIEIGPGEGTLTKILLEKAGKVVAIEKDKTLVKLLNERWSDEIADGKLRVIEGDVLEIAELKNLLPGKKYKLVGNIPY